MTSSQILISSLFLIGFVFLLYLLVYFASGLRRLWRKAPVAFVRNDHERKTLLAARFSDIPLPVDAPMPDVEPKTPMRPRLQIKWVWFGMVVLAIAIAALSEFGFIIILGGDPNGAITLPVIGVMLAGLLFAFANHKMVVDALPLPFTAVLPERIAPPATLWVTNLVLTFVVLSGTDIDLPIWANYLVFFMWIFNILLFCWNVAQLANASMPSRDEIQMWWRTHRLEVLLLSLIGLAAFLIRFIGLETYPYAFINDEGEVGWEGLNILFGSKSNFFITGWAGQSMLAFLPVALSIKILGLTAVAVRLFGALQGTLAVVCLYLAAREAFGRPVAFFSSCLLAALPWHVHFSRLGVMNISASFFSSAVLWLTYRALRRGKYLDYLAAGLMTGLALYTYVGSRLAIAMAIGVLGYVIISQRDYLRTHFRHLTIFIFALLIVASPALYSGSRHWDDFMGRTNQEGLFSGNNLQQLADNAGIKPSDLIRNQIQSSTTIFFAMAGPGQFFDTPRPYVTWLTAIFLFLGMIYVFWHFKQVRYMMLIGWFWSPVLLGSAFTMEPPSHQRMLAAAPALVLIVAIGLWKLAQSIQLSTGASKRWLVTACVLFVVFTTAVDLNFYFLGDFRTGHYFEIYGNEFSYEVGLRADQLGPNYRLLLLGDPFVYAAFADFHYLTNTAVSVEDFNGVTPETIDALTHEKGFFFAAIPEHMNDLKLIQQKLPGGTWVEVSRHTQEGILYYGYILPPPAAP